MDAAIARRMARDVEALHTFIYFVPEAMAAYREAGLDEGRMSYFAPRAAPLGAASAELVSAAFFGFNPAFVRRFIPEAWRRASPERVLAARQHAADQALRRMLGEQIESPAVAEAAELARRACAGCHLEARARFAAHAGLPWPAEPHLALWHAATLLREYRTDSHYVALLAGGLGAVESLVMHVAIGGRPIETLKSSRGWSDEAWDAASRRLQAAGWLNPDGSVTETGRLRREEIEVKTDELSLAPWARLGAEGCERLATLTRPLTAAIVAAGTFPPYLSAHYAG